MVLVLNILLFWKHWMFLFAFPCWNLFSHMLHDQWVIKEITEEIKNFLEFNENESITYQKPMRHWKLSAKGKIYRHEYI
jgi:hypothetical protein